MGKGKELFINNIPDDEPEQAHAGLLNCYFLLGVPGLGEQQSVPSVRFFIDFMKNAP